MNILRLIICSTWLLLPALELNAFEWRCCLPRAKYYGDWEMERIDAQGIVELDHTRVTRGLSVRGSLDADGAEISSAYIEGRAIIENSSINGDVNIIGTGIFKGSRVAGITQVGGPLEGFCSNFCGGIQTSASYVELHNSTSPFIYFFPCSQEIQIVKLLHGTVVEGDIEFAGQGRVFIDRTSILNGAVRGGWIVEPCY